MFFNELMKPLYYLKVIKKALKGILKKIKVECIILFVLKLPSSVSQYYVQTILTSV